MKLAVSNIAWSLEEESAMARLLQKTGVKYVELAPTKLWTDPTVAPAKAVKDVVSFWRRHNIEVVAFQSMLYNRPDLKIFDPITRPATLKYLQDFIKLAGRMGAKSMVFGSPKNRQRGQLRSNEAMTIAQEFFDQLGHAAAEQKVFFCLEPNPPDYACDFVTDSMTGIEFVSKINNPGLGLHLDIGCMTLAGDDIPKSIKAAKEILRHFHISSPFLEAVESRPDVNHFIAAQSLKAIGYEGFLSIEMRPGKVGQNFERVKKAINFAYDTYG